MRRLTLIVFVAAVLMVGGCVDIFTRETKGIMADNAQRSRNFADQAAAGKLTPADMAYYLECFARGFANLDAAGNWQAPPFPHAPTNRPTTLPWKPEGGTDPSAGGG